MKYIRMYINVYIYIYIIYFYIHLYMYVYMYILLYILYTNIFHQKYYILTIYGVMLSYLLMTLVTSSGDI